MSLMLYESNLFLQEEQCAIWTSEHYFVLQKTGTTSKDVALDILLLIVVNKFMK